MSFKDLNNLDQEKFIAKLVFQTLQEMGGQAERSEIREHILGINED